LYFDRGAAKANAQSLQKFLQTFGAFILFNPLGKLAGRAIYFYFILHVREALAMALKVNLLALALKVNSVALCIAASAVLSDNEVIQCCVATLN